MSNELSAKGSGVESRTDSVGVLYLSANTLFGAELRGATEQAIQDWKWALPRSSAHEDYAGLSCNGDGTVVAHVSRNAGTDPLHSRRSDIVVLDVHSKAMESLGVERVGNLSWPVISPDGAWIAATAYGGGRDALAIIDRKAKSVKVILHSRSVSPHSWSPRGDRIFATALDESDQSSNVIEYSMKEGRFSPIALGSRPVPSLSMRLIAILDPENGAIRIVDADGSETARIREGFKGIVGWIDDFNVLATSSTHGLDSFGIVDIRSHKVTRYKLETRGEINGACIASRRPR